MAKTSKNEPEVICIDDDDDVEEGRSPSSVIVVGDDDEGSSRKRKIVGQSEEIRVAKREYSEDDDVVFLKETPGALKKARQVNDEVIEVSVNDMSSADKEKLIQRLLAEKKEMKQQQAAILSVSRNVSVAPQQARPSYWRRDGAGHRLRMNPHETSKATEGARLPGSRDPSRFVLLEPGNSEYDTIAHRFLNTRLQCVEIISIHRHMNSELWEPYAMCRNRIRASLGDDPNANYTQDMLPGLEAEAGGYSHEKCCERYLFHGASPSTIESILDAGIDFRLSKIEGAMGACAYFADTAAYSHNYCCMPEHAAGTTGGGGPRGATAVAQVILGNTGGHSLKMLVCRCLLGDCTDGIQGLRRPPAKKNNSSLLYNSVSNRPSEAPHFHSQGFMFGVFANDQVYPEYVIEYKRTGANADANTAAMAAAIAGGATPAAAYAARLHQIAMAYNAQANSGGPQLLHGRLPGRARRSRKQ